jgi:hypothetical protein
MSNKWRCGARQRPIPALPESAIPTILTPTFRVRFAYLKTRQRRAGHEPLHPDCAQAIADYQLAIQLGPKDIDTYRSLVELLTACARTGREYQGDPALLAPDH